MKAILPFIKMAKTVEFKFGVCIKKVNFKFMLMLIDYFCDEIILMVENKSFKGLFGILNYHYTFIL